MHRHVFLLAFGLAHVATAQQAADTSIALPPQPALARFGIFVREVARFPKSEPSRPTTDARLNRHARINYLGEIPDGSGRLFVPDLNGKLYTLKDGVITEYLDVRAVVGPTFHSSQGMGSGFGFVAFDPDFARNGRFYTVHTETGDALTTKTSEPPEPNTVVHGVLTEWTAAHPAAATFRGTHRELLRLGFATYVHGIQQIGFNPTARRGDPDRGLLYIAVGDGGIGHVTNIPQDLTNPYGKILRLDPRTGKHEIFASGVRDPHRFSWDAAGTHRMFLAHIGEHFAESIYDVRRGDNLGWSDREGTFVFDKANRCTHRTPPPDEAKDTYVYPVAQYTHAPKPGMRCDGDQGHAISGGFVYRGRAVPHLRGKYLFADLVDGRVMYAEEREMRRGRTPAVVREIRVFDAAGRPTRVSELIGDPRVDLRFGMDAAGELYLLSKANGVVWKIIGTRAIPSR